MGGSNCVELLIVCLWGVLGVGGGDGSWTTGVWEQRGGVVIKKGGAKRRGRTAARRKRAGASEMNVLLWRRDEGGGGGCQLYKTGTVIAGECGRCTAP